MTREPDFRELVGGEGTPEELERLRRVHDLLVAAGPPPELSPRIAEAPRLGQRELRWRPRRRLEAALVLAAGLLAVAFAIGYLVGNRGGDFPTQRQVALQGVGRLAAASASIRIGEADEKGNWPLLITVRGLEPLKEGGWYELYLTKSGQPLALCGTFKADAEFTTVRMSVAYERKRYDGWVVVARYPGKRAQVEEILMRTETI